MLITADKTLNLSDFGVAEEFDSYSNKPMETSRFAGTHQFLSPEITSGKDSYDGEKGRNLLLFLKLILYIYSGCMGSWSYIVICIKIILKNMIDII